MKKAAIIPLLLLSLASIAEPQTFDSSSSVASRTSPLTVSHTTGSGTRRKMAACVVMRRTLGSNPAPSVSAASYNGVGLTCSGANAVNSGITFAQLCHLDDPASGAHDLSVSIANIDGPVHVHAMTISNAEPGAPEAFGSFSDTGGGRSSVVGPTSIQTIWSDSLVLECVAVASDIGATTIEPTSGQTAATDLSSGILRSRFARKTVSTGQHGHGWTVAPHATGRVVAQMSFARRDETTPGLLANAEWVSIPNSSMNSVYIPAVDDQWEIRGVPGLYPEAWSKIQSAWGGATCVGDELYLMGGGHDEGVHNGILKVNALNGVWTRVREPSGQLWKEVGCVDGMCETPYGPCEMLRCNPQPGDFAPASRHTYYLLTNDGTSLYVSGGSTYELGTKGDFPTSWRYDIAADQWSPFQEAPNSDSSGAMIYLDGKLYLITNQTVRKRTIFDGATGLWDTGTSSQGAGAGGQVALIYSPTSDRFFNIGNGQARYVARSGWNTAATTSIPNQPAMVANPYLGATYYPPEDLILLWDGGQTITTLNSTTLEWGAVTPGGEDPGAAGVGALGRFSYCGGKVVLVNGVAKNLFQLDIPSGGPVCGDELLEPPEACDDGNTTSGDGCSPTCTIEAAVCGNNVVETVPPWSGTNEQCDVGDTTPGDGCSATCQIESPPGMCVGGIANGIVNEPEECDNGTNGSNLCTPNCEIIFPQVFTSPARQMPVWLTPPTDPVTGVVTTHCGDESTWTTLEVTNDTEAFNLRNRTGKYIVNVHWKEVPYGALDVKTMKCVRITGIPGPEGQRPLVANVNKNRADDIAGGPLRGGMIIENLQISAGLAYTLTGGVVGVGVTDCVGMPNDQDFVIIRDTEISRCGHHALIAGHAHQMYIELDNVHLFQASSHLAYIDHIAMAYVHDSLIESPGNGHALRSVAGNTIIEDTQISNIQFDGTILPVGGSNPLEPDRTYIGMHPLDVYVCGNVTINNVDVTMHSAAGKNGFFAANLRGREAFQTCDIGEPDALGEFYTPLSYIRDPEDFQNPARWATVTPWQATVTNMTVRCTAAGLTCNGWDIDGSYPTMHDPHKTLLQRWLRSRTFANWDELVAEIAFFPQWASIATMVVTSHRSNFMLGNNPNKVPLPVPIPGWFQRANFTLNNFSFTEGGTNVIRPKNPPDAFCFGTPAVGNGCTEQYDGDGAQYAQAFITVNP